MIQFSRFLNRAARLTKLPNLSLTAKAPPLLATSTGDNQFKSDSDSPSFNSEMLSLPMLEQLASELAAEHIIVNIPGSFQPMQHKLSQCQKLLWLTYRAFSKDVKAQVAIPPAGEWLLDNFTIVIDQLREIKEDLPNRYYHKLPKLLNGALAGNPRVYALALELLKHTDSRIDEEHLLRFIHAYQTIDTLTMAELWAVAIMLRLGLIESLSNLAADLMQERQFRQEGQSWAERLLKAENESLAGKQALQLELLHKYPAFPAAFTVQLLRYLRDYEGSGSPANSLTWLEHQLSLQNSNPEMLIRLEKQKQAANQTTAGNTITSMRFLSGLDWSGWFENVSKVEQILSRDQSGIYRKSTFATRDHYRHEVENLARQTGKSEMAVAWQVIELAKDSLPGKQVRPAHAHVGYYLVGAGRSRLEGSLSFEPGPSLKLKRLILDNPTPFYLGSVALGTAGLLAAAIKISGAGFRRPGTLLAAGLLALPASEVAEGLVNWGITKALKPRVLPRLDLNDGIPAEFRTIVVIPMLLLTPESLEGLFDRLEILYLANQDPNLHFALLSDFADAAEPDMPEDTALLTLAQNRVKELNVRYGKSSFLFFHRSRVFNTKQGCYMGWERKRGKLEEFNRLLLGLTNTTFEVQLGELSLLPQFRYVITLDADTQLPRNSAKALIGTIAHPLNEAVIDPVSGRVGEGYGILQPRSGIDLTSATSSRFARLFSGNVGIDPYTTAVSNVYMDLFGEGIYAGKGIYDPVILHQVLGNRFPENKLLSHDLIEGNYARTGLLADVELLDNYPTTYTAYLARVHRWVRGDWQIAGWLRFKVPNRQGLMGPNSQSWIGRYKIFDNLRRSLVLPDILVLLGTIWLGLPGRASVLALCGLLPLALPNLFSLVNLLLALLRPANPFTRLAIEGPNLGSEALRLLVNLVFLPGRALVNLDAIGRTLNRLIISKRNFLEWETAEQAQERLDQAPELLIKRRLRVVVGGLFLLILKSRSLRISLKEAGVLVAGSFSPLVLGWWLAKLPAKTFTGLNEVDRAYLRQMARYYWHYFETFVTAENNYLAPDNFQEDPAPVIAARTSPTNIGLQLMADIAAFDFGYIGLTALTGRTEKVFTTLENLEHYRGHLLNWYDTESLQPLSPRYISMVDSGNLAGYFLTLRQSYLQFQDQPVISPNSIKGLLDTVGLLVQSLSPRDPALNAISEITRLLSQSPVNSTEYGALFIKIKKCCQALKVTGLPGNLLVQLTAQVEGLLEDLESFLPWINSASSGPELAVMEALSGPPPTLNELVYLTEKALEDIDPVTHPHLKFWLNQSRQNALALLDRHKKLAAFALTQVQQMDFKFLYDEKRKLFSIGYFVTEGRTDNSYYDLLASEARLGSFIAIAKGDVPQEHWFKLGRSLTPVGIRAALASWSGTMFEYLMPLLVMRNYPRTLLDETYKVVVKRQIEYGQQRKVPWGISESAFNARDLNMNYQYQAFGVPELGLKRGLGNKLVVAPYATFLALQVFPELALKNIRNLQNLGLLGTYGFYDAVDYSAVEQHTGKEAIVRNYMVHHQGMSLMALDNLLHYNLMQDRFHAEPAVQATQRLLQEQIPHSVSRQYLPEEAFDERPSLASPELTTRQFNTPNTAAPHTHLISNGAYTVIVTNSGGGFSRFNGLAVTRWQADITRDNWGNFCYIRDVGSGITWSGAYQPTCHESEDYQVIYSLERAEYRQQKAGIETRLDVTVSPEDNAEVRQLSLTNLTPYPREVELTSYAEIVLATAAADNAHPAFSKLFIETEYVAASTALLGSRRPRSPQEESTWAFHVVAVKGHVLGNLEYETDRAAFLGRGRSVRNPQSLDQPLTNTTGNVLDPIFSFRRRARIVPGGTVNVTFTTGVAPTREEALSLADKYSDSSFIPRVFELAANQALIELNSLNLKIADVYRFQRLASRVIYPDAWMRAAPAILASNRKGQSGLWSYGISGDFPIILLDTVSGEDGFGLLQELLQVHEYWRVNGLKVDLVVLNREMGGYNRLLHNSILSVVRSSSANNWLNRPGGIFVLEGSTIPEEDLVLLQTVARVILYSNNDDLAHQLSSKRLPGVLLEPLIPVLAVASPTDQVLLPAVELEWSNEYGGFRPDGKEYIIDLLPGKATPAPWTNILANESFGCLVTERGSTYTWSENSRENRLTPWSNDPVSDPSGETYYLKEAATGVVWSPTAQPCGYGQFRTRHGFGYSTFENRYNGLATELTIFVPVADPIKIYRLKIHNLSSTSRKLSATFYAEWVLGVQREEMSPYVVTSFDAETKALLANNHYNPEFAGRVAFTAGGAEEGLAFTCDRREFLGRNGSTALPAGLGEGALSGQTGPGLDPCAVLQQYFELGPGEEQEIIFVLGQGSDLEHSRSLIRKYRQPGQITVSINENEQHWQNILGKVQVKTPMPEFDLLQNGWLLYQTLVCRIWGRSAFYQSGGAYGFRDQLQDVMALAHSAPQIMRKQLLRAAQHQFLEGDVQHWWHPPTGRGIRTDFSDDYLWLPFVTHFYLSTTGETGILDELLSFIEDRPRNPNEAEYYATPHISEQVGSLYEHCTRAIEYGLSRFGSHGLPLMGSGDWNDGMNLVGAEDRGESVWVGWFLYLNLSQMAEIARNRNDLERAEGYLEKASQLKLALEEAGWDGEWFRRAYFDDGTPLGSTTNEECRIDSLVQSWAVISGGAEESRVDQALSKVDKHLVDREAGIIKLFTPPFNQPSINPGYINGYPPGVRENGGQYTHAAIWVIWAYAMRGKGKQAAELISLINPVNHSIKNVGGYKVEPYVIAADVYSSPAHLGQGGWTWYTGSAAWLYRLGLEKLLGLRRNGNYLRFEPCIPPEWQQYEVIYFEGQSLYIITVLNPFGVSSGGIQIELDDTPCPDGMLPLCEDGQIHRVKVLLSPSPASSLTRTDTLNPDC